MKNFSSYAGYYKNMYLRSSYEYIFVKILEKSNANFKYEEKIYYLKDARSIKPDFHIYNINNRLIKIIEVKSENKERYNSALSRLNQLKQETKIPFEIVQQNELKALCVKYKLNFDKLKRDWINSDKTSKNHVLSKENNPMYNRKQSESSKKKNGLKTKIRFKDENFRLKHSNAVKEAMKNVDKSILAKGRIKDRETRKCKYCGEDFIVIETSKQVYCSNLCGSRAMFRLASDTKKQRNIERSEQIINELIKWAIDNKESLKEIPLNRISKTFSQIFNEILVKYDLNDHRNVFFSFYGEYKAQYKRLLNDLIEITK